MRDLIVSVPDHCLSFYFTLQVYLQVLDKQGKNNMDDNVSPCFNPIEEVRITTAKSYTTLHTIVHCTYDSKHFTVYSHFIEF